MSQSLLNKVWSFITVLLLYLCLNVWSITQQWQLSFPGNPFKVENVSPYGVTLYGVPICGVLLVLVSVTTRIYASRSPKVRWEDRLPRFADFQLDTNKAEAKAFQVIMLVSLLLLPAVAVIHFLATFMNGTVCGLSNFCNAASTFSCDCAVRISGWHAMLFEPRTIPADIALKYDPNVAKNIGPGFVQLWEPWTYLMVTVIAVCSAIWCITAVFQPELHRLRRLAGRKS
jgi:uncharacterized integral membrane protein